jgi:CO/xanthine dehydrogenase FAD-binding subunit
MTREYAAEESGTIAAPLPLLAAALPQIGHEAIRSRGTIGGSLAHAEPAAELPAVALALDAELVVRSQPAERALALRRAYLRAAPALRPGSWHSSPPRTRVSELAAACFSTAGRVRAHGERCSRA